MGIFTNTNKTSNFVIKEEIKKEDNKNENLYKNCENCYNLSTYNIGKENEYTFCIFEDICFLQHWKRK